MQRRRLAATISVILLALLVLAGCGTAADPVAVTSGHDPAAVQRSVQSWWWQLTDTTGFVEGTIVGADGRPVARAGLSCSSHAQRGHNDIGHLTDEAGRYRCGGAPGRLTVEVYDPLGGGVIVTQDVDLVARQTITRDLVAARPAATPTPTPIRCC